MGFSERVLLGALCYLTFSTWFCATNGNIHLLNLMGHDHSNSIANATHRSAERESRNANAGPFHCGEIIGGHYMFGSASSYCGGYSVRDCSALCFFRNFTFFQCEGFVCHCFSP